ncbi:MAG: AAC(3) family N-acetyltransferase, partial [Acidimicrobiia bacterium]|nr:AAC(3) family N-acetyltransferase [Acidimicrobiia bacterium]
MRSQPSSSLRSHVLDRSHASVIGAPVISTCSAFSSGATTPVSHLSDPAHWRNPPVPESWWQSIRDETPAFDPRLTPTAYMGAIVECFRHAPGVRRSAHPTVSFAAVGPHRDTIVDDHALDGAMGEASPLARLYDLDARVLLLGVGHANNTSLHLAEARAEPDGPWGTEGSPVLVDGERRWVTYTSHDGDASDFEACGAAFAASAPRAERTGPVGAATT